MLSLGRFCAFSRDDVVCYPLQRIVAPMVKDRFGYREEPLTARLGRKHSAEALAHRPAGFGALDQERRQLIDRYTDMMAGDDYIQANPGKKTRLAAALRSPNHEDFVDASVRQFCA